MSCAHGRVRPTSATQRKLFAASAGICQRPECRVTLFPEDAGKDITIAEIAHIIAAVPKGPRDDNALNADERATFDNLILLCPTCHTIVDKDADNFPIELIRRWKSEHARLILEQFGAPIVGNRDTLLGMIGPMMAENRVVFEDWNPDLDYRFNPEAEQAAVWKRKMRSTILPNSERVILLLDANRRLLKPDEMKTLVAFRQHVDDLTDKHVLGLKNIATRFPEGMNDLCR